MTETIALRPYEIDLIKILVKSSPHGNLILENIDQAKPVSLDFSGVGYFLTLFHPNFPKERCVCDIPYVSGKSEDSECGFLIFLENRELTIECHTSQDELPECFRDSLVALSVK